MFGSHLSIAGGLENALIKAHELGMDCVQIFTKNQRQWRAPALKKDQIQRWLEHLESTGIQQTVSHDSYLINLASPPGDNRDKSIALYQDELTRCDLLHIPNLVMHPGSHMKAGETTGLARIVQALDYLHEQLPELDVITCLEITAGQGTALGYKLEHLAAIIQSVREPDRLGVCLDTAHMLAAGYDLTSAAGARDTIKQIDDIVSLDRVRVLHLNDSKTPRGSRVDRHAHIGHGHVSLDAFGVIVNHPAFAEIPKILETPKETDDDGREWDTINLETLRGMLEKAGTRPSVTKKTKKTKKSAKSTKKRPPTRR